MKKNLIIGIDEMLLDTVFEWSLDMLSRILSAVSSSLIQLYLVFLSLFFSFFILFTKYFIAYLNYIL